MIAALFVEGAPRGVYASAPGVELWTRQRDARLYAGPWPVVAHPPCERWGDLASGGPRQDGGRAKERGADEGCFASALGAVRRWGGVLEHPARSRAWRAHGLARPPAEGGWVRADELGGLTCHVEQGHYGHRARKATWLYLCGAPSPPGLAWGTSARPAAPLPRWAALPPRGLSPAERAERRRLLETYERESGKVWCCPERMNRSERAATPAPFRDLLLSLARAASPSALAA